MTQLIRPSQFIITYGPGSILETQEGPVIMPTPDNGLFTTGSPLDPNDYKIENERMTKYLSRMVNSECKIFKLPTNAELSLSNNEHIYKTKRFPQWKLCLNQNSHPERTDVLYLAELCPVCNDKTGGRGDTIRFVMVCRNGHLNDVSWDYLVHGKNECSHMNIGKISGTLNNPRVFQWIRTGGALRDIEIKCPRCGMTKNFGNAYYDNWKCSGRNPERETVTQPPVIQPGCGERAAIMQRQAANIRIPEIRTLLSIQSILTKMHQLIQNEKIRTTIKNAQTFIGEIDSPEKLDKVLKAMGDAGVPENSIREFRNASWDEVRQVISSMDVKVPESYHELILDEFRELEKASMEGAPPTGYKGKSKRIFEVIKHDIKPFKTRNGRTFVVTPVSTLETITAQIGFRRAVSEDTSKKQPPLVDIGFIDKFLTKWYPAVSFLGEGIFIRLEEECWTDGLVGDSVARWASSHSRADEYDRDFVFRDPQNSKDEMHPGFVWWHTLSHLLIRVISEEAGYSTASIRERIFLEKKGGKTRGGILLYAAQPGAEGTLGGMTGLVPHFGKFLDTAIERSASCSADPICGEQEFEHLQVNGSCCYGCLMNSETSCEHRNMWLDRTILRDNIP